MIHRSTPHTHGVRTVQGSGGRAVGHRASQIRHKEGTVVWKKWGIRGCLSVYGPGEVAGTGNGNVHRINSLVCVLGVF